MPEMDGYEATRFIRSMGTPKGRSIPIVAMTANVFREDIEKCLEAGMNDHVGKPLNLDEVMQKMRRYLQSDEDSAPDKSMVRYNPSQNEPSTGWTNGIAWNPRLETGHEKIDSQHKQLFKLTSDLAESCSNGSNAQSVGNALDFLASYAVDHFSDEEDLMKLHGYPEYAGHKQKHDGFKETVADLINTYKATGSSADLSGKVNSVIVRWLTAHITQVDRKMAEYVKSQDNPKR
jgi:hemerythrin